MTDTFVPVNLVRDTKELVNEQVLGASTSLVDYQSHGGCLVIGDTEQALSLLPQLESLRVTVLDIDNSLGRPEKKLTDQGTTVFRSPRPEISGYLGAYTVQVQEDNRTHDLAVMAMTETGHFDLVLDLSKQPLLISTLAPFGYFRAPDEDSLAKALETLPGLLGEFEKPRYFDYQRDICAHSRSNLMGCNRCADVCAADAISHDGEGIEVNPWLCQGCGSCASVCPTGAMTYAWPRPADAIERTRELLDQGRAGVDTLLLYASNDEEDVDANFESQLPAHVLALAVEEVSAYGIDYWATMLASGFEKLVVVCNDSDNHTDTLALQAQATILDNILAGLGSSDATDKTNRIVFTSAEPDALQAATRPLDDTLVRLAQKSAPRFATHGDKRQTFRMAVDQLATHLEPREPVAQLPAGSPVGEVQVRADGCTLCMACVSVCPAGALLDGQEQPKLRFIESNCVQCGLCEQACPESVISLQPGYRYDSLAARETVTLNEEEPFHCVRCHKAFATRKMIDNMTVKLAGHWMFTDEKAMRRLRMCEDCRVMDMFENEQGGIEVHRDEK